MSRARMLPMLMGLLLSAALSVLCPDSLQSQTRYRPELKPYVEFLSRRKTSAKDYILGLFKTHDLVIICERHHPEVTQYDLFLSIIRDSRFVDSVGNIFTEIGTITQAPAVNAFIHADRLPADSVDRAVLRFQRNCSAYPLWEKPNYAAFIRDLYTLNQSLPSARKIDLYNCDVPFDWATVDTTGLKSFYEHLGEVRDSIIAAQVIGRFDGIRKSRPARRKALVIMNYRHAFRHDTKAPSGVIARNVGRFLFSRYGERVANVYLNNLALVSARADNDVTFDAVQGGKWDAAFRAADMRNAGFDFRDSPFGRDTFDIWPANVHSTWENEFSGFAFYLPLDEQKLVFGMPELIDSAFGYELARRNTLFRPRPNGRPWTVDDIEGMKRDLNISREMRIDNLDSLNLKISRWLSP